MIGLYITLGIALLIALILLVRAKVIITYNEDLTVYLRVLFFKVRLVPPGEKKHKRKRKKQKNKGALESTGTKSENKNKKDGVASKLWALREVLLYTIEKFLGKLHFKFVRLNIVVASSNAATTALLYGAATQGVSYLLEVLENISNVDITKRSDISVRSDFLSEKSTLEGKIILYMSVAHLIYVGIHFLKKLFKSKIKVEE